MSRAAFFIGQLVHHRLFGYRGVVVDADPVFQGSDLWYDTVAKTRPPKDAPWYHVLVDGQDAQTYVAERNLEPDRRMAPISHPLLDDFFTGFHEGGYVTRQEVN